MLNQESRKLNFLYSKKIQHALGTSHGSRTQTPETPRNDGVYFQEKLIFFAKGTLIF